MLLSSSAGPLPTVEKAPDFRCRPARPEWAQEADCNEISDADAEIFEGENATFRCRQRNRRRPRGGEGNGCAGDRTTKDA